MSLWLDKWPGVIGQTSARMNVPSRGKVVPQAETKTSNMQEEVHPYGCLKKYTQCTFEAPLYF